MAERPVRPTETTDGEITRASRAEVEGVAEQAASIAVQSVISEKYSGQFPHPDHLERYAALHPDAPRVIFESFERQGDHRRAMEKKYVEGTEKRASIGQILGFVLVASVIALGVFVSANGQPVAGTTMVGLALTSGALTYVFGVRHKSK